MRILLLAHCFAHSNANTFRYRDLAEYLSRSGHTIDIIGEKTLTDYELPAGATYFSLKKELVPAALLPVLWYSLTEIFNSFSLWRSAISHPYIGYTILQNGIVRYRINKLLSRHRYDVILMGVTPWTLYTLARKLSKAAPLVIDISDPLYKNAFVDSDPQGSRRLKRFEKKALKYATSVIVMSEPLVDLYREEIQPSGSVTFVSPAARTDGYQPNRLHTVTLRERLRFLYAGTVYPGYRDLEEILPAISRHAECSLEVISNLNRPDRSNICYRPWVPQKELMQLYRQADILVFIDNFWGYQVPSKIFELLAMNKPILFVYDERNPYLYNKLSGQKGIYFCRNDREEIDETISRILSCNTIEVEYTFDLEPYSTHSISHRLTTLLEQATDKK